MFNVYESIITNGPRLFEEYELQKQPNFKPF
jgi:hypothetical protein